MNPRVVPAPPTHLDLAVRFCFYFLLASAKGVSLTLLLDCAVDRL